VPDLERCDVTDRFSGARCTGLGPLTTVMCVHEHMLRGHCCPHHRAEGEEGRNKCATCLEGPEPHQCTVTYPWQPNGETSAA
jgi:hypothetical protein